MEIFLLFLITVRMDFLLEINFTGIQKMHNFMRIMVDTINHIFGSELIDIFIV